MKKAIVQKLSMMQGGCHRLHRNCSASRERDAVTSLHTALSIAAVIASAARRRRSRRVVNGRVTARRPAATRSRSVRWSGRSRTWRGSNAPYGRRRTRDVL
jgi:hypothetical protein